jgi:hypothetical protein
MTHARIAFVDCEASSVDEHRSYPIEVGWCFVGDVDAESHLIVPHPDWIDWDPQSQEIHGLSRRFLFEQGEPGPQVARRLVAALKGATAYADSDMDQLWLTKLCAAAAVTPAPTLHPFDALLQQTLQDMPYASRLKLTLEARWFADANAPRTHRAGPDALHLRTWYQEALRLAASATKSRDAGSRL